MLFLLILASCSSSRSFSNEDFVSKINDSVMATQQEELDSILSALQKQNDLLLVFADENFAWTRMTSYHILAKNGEEWKGYFYKGSNRKMSANSDTIYKEITVSKEDANDLLAFFNANELWKVKGDDGKNFCAEVNNTSNGSKPAIQKCNIYDANTWQLFIITHDKVISPSYYAPDFYERCCPGNTDRKHFVEAAKKIRSLIQPTASDAKPL